MKLTRVLLLAALSAALVLVASCTTEIKIRNVCDTTLTDIEVDGDDVGSLAPGEEASVDADDRGRTEVVWKYNGTSYRDWISGNGVYEGAVWDLDCYSGSW